jgi:hypothetical protein
LSVTVLAPIASIISYALLYYFVFEMMYMVSTIKSMTHVDRMTRNRRIKIIKIVLFSLYIGIYIPCTLIGHIMYKENPQYYYGQITLFRVNQGLRIVIKLPMDLFMIYEFLKAYFYFLQRKKESIDAKLKNIQMMSLGTSRKTGKKDLKKLNYYTYWVIFLSFLKFLNALSITIVYGLYYSYRPQE